MPTEVRTVDRKGRPRSLWRRSLQLRSGLIISLLVLLGFGIGLLTFSSAHKAWNGWRESHLLRQADAQLDQDHLEQAKDLAQRALVMDPNSLTAARILADATEKQNRVETVGWRAQIARLHPTIDNQLNLASAALRFGQLDVARRAVQQVPKDDREAAAYQVVAGWLSRAEGNSVEEERHFAAAVRQDPSNDLYKFNLAVLQIRSPDPEKNAAARNELERLTKVSQFRTEALRALLENALRENQTEAATDLAQQLQMSPQVSFADYLLCLDLYRKLNPKKLDALLEKVKPAAARQVSDLAQLINWMNKNKLASEALRWSDKLPDDLTSRPPAAAAIAESLALTKSWSRLKRWTRSGSWAEDDYVRLAYQAYAARKSRRSGVDAEFDELWKTAVKAAASNPEHQLALARLASKWELTQQAEPLWQEVAKTTTARREALDALYKIYRENNDLPNLSVTAQQLHETSPDEVELAANAARFALLLDRNSAAGRELARRAYAKAPNDTAAAVTYAFALYRDGRTGDGIEVLKKLSPDQLRDPHPAIYAALLFDAGSEVEIADQYLALAKAGHLYPEEKQLLEEISTRRQNAAPPSPSPRPEAME